LGSPPLSYEANASKSFPNIHYPKTRTEPSRQSKSWPNKLDNTAAGGITAGDSPTETIIRECLEEASLTENVVRAGLKATGIVTYIFKGVEGWLQVI